MTDDPAWTGLGGLNSHEVAIIELVVKGMSNQTIGERLGIAEGDVMRSVATIFKTLNIQNRLEAIRTWQRLQAEAPTKAK